MQDRTVLEDLHVYQFLLEPVVAAASAVLDGDLSSETDNSRERTKMSIGLWLGLRWHRYADNARTPNPASYLAHLASWDMFINTALAPLGTMPRPQELKPSSLVIR